MGDPDLAIRRLDQAGWLVRRNARGHRWAWSPDGLVRVGYQPDYDPDAERSTWTVEVYWNPEDDHKVWMVDFTEETPVERVTAVIDEVVETVQADSARLLPPDDDTTASAGAAPGMVGASAERAVSMRLDPGGALQPLKVVGWAAGATGTSPEIEAWSPDERVYVACPIRFSAASREICLVHAYGQAWKAVQWNALIGMATPVKVAARLFDALQVAYHVGVLRDHDTPPPDASTAACIEQV